MKPRDWSKVEELYHAALAKDAAGRKAFLDRACSGDEDLRREVESLLGYEREADRLMEQPASSAATQKLAVVRGTRLGPYEVTDLIGAGGMARFTAPPTRGWTATSRSRSCPSTWRTTRTPWRGSAGRPTTGSPSSSGSARRGAEETWALRIRGQDPSSRQVEPLASIPGHQTRTASARTASRIIGWRLRTVATSTFRPSSASASRQKRTKANPDWPGV